MTGLAAAFAALLASLGLAQPSAFQGYAEGDYVQMGPADTGRLVALDVARGDEVKAGAPLFSLDLSALTAARDQAAEQGHVAQAALALARVDLARAALLRARGTISQQALDQAQTAVNTDEAQVSAAHAALRIAEWHLSEAAPRAPKAGLITDTYFRPGEIVGAGQPVISLLPPGNIKVRFYVPEGALDRFKVGTAVDLTCDGCGPPIPGIVRYIAPAAEYTPPVLFNRENRAKLVFMIEAWPNTRPTSLHPGQPVDVTLPPAVPTQAPRR